MEELRNLNYSAFSAGYTSGEFMTIIYDDSSFDDIVSWIFDSKSLWYYDGIKYRIVIHFEYSDSNTVTLYYFDDSGNIVGKAFSGEE